MTVPTLKCPWSVVGISSLLGMLAVDAVFDFGEADRAKTYYCTLLPSLTSFPFSLRVVIPVLFSGLSILWNLSSSWTWCEATKVSSRLDSPAVYHLGTCAVLLLGGTPCFAVSVRAVFQMCQGNIQPEAEALPTLQRAHLALLVIFLMSMLLETMALSKTEKLKTKMEKQKARNSASFFGALQQKDREDGQKTSSSDARNRPLPWIGY
ncbi:unnamed protein product [Durusdinium trenchii]|uniref:Uncharacterized protein n=1 Tax=Durusdinium trenchii TaxID=1381693 RepID=A0ABP0HYL8_9DINO